MFKRRFNVAGPCVEGRHYMIDPLSRLPEAPGLVDQGAYFVVHAPRQTGKTTSLIALARELTRLGQYVALYSSCQTAAALEALDQALPALVEQLAADARLQLPPELQPPPITEGTPSQALATFLRNWSLACPRPVVLFLDEIDALKGSPLINVLHQLRDGYRLDRPRQFPWSVILCGMKDVRDYKALSGGDPTRLGTSSPFNIKLKSMRIGDFDEAEVNTLLDQHTADTGQVFTPEARAQVFAFTRGQPWLTNALGLEIVDGMKVTGPVEAGHVDRAKENLILARATHLDSLLARLEEPRVHKLIQPIIAGSLVLQDPQLNDDVLYLRDLGLIARDNPIRIANPIYKEVIVRVLGAGTELNITVPRQRFIALDGRLDLDILLSEFLAFWKRNGDALTKRETYHEVAAQLVLMAWLHRIVNGGGFVDREYGIGRGRIDVLIRWPLPDGTVQQEAFELKVRGPKEGDPLEEGLEQLDEYLDRLGLNTGVLALFDRRPKAPPIARRSGLSQVQSPKGRTITLLRA